MGYTDTKKFRTHTEYNTEQYNFEKCSGGEGEQEEVSLIPQSNDIGRMEITPPLYALDLTHTHTTHSPTTLTTTATNINPTHTTNIPTTFITTATNNNSNYFTHTPTTFTTTNYPTTTTSPSTPTPTTINNTDNHPIITFSESELTELKNSYSSSFCSNTSLSLNYPSLSISTPIMSSTQIDYPTLSTPCPSIMSTSIASPLSIPPIIFD